MPLFRKAARQDPLIVSMAGAALGSRVLIVSTDDIALPVDVGAKAGLSGHTLALATSCTTADRIAACAERRGVFVETGVLALPLTAGASSFDLVIADDRGSAAGTPISPALLAETFRVLRPGGRIVVLRPAARSWWPLSRSTAAPRADDALRDVLVHAGFRATRLLGTREGISFTEAAKAA